MEKHQISWLGAHPERSREWLKERLLDGFHIHHVDGNHSNNDPLNLVLLEGTDHLRLHAGSMKAGLKQWKSRAHLRSGELTEEMLELGRRVYNAKARLGSKLSWKNYVRLHHVFDDGEPQCITSAANTLMRRARTYARVNKLSWPPATDGVVLRHVEPSALDFAAYQSRAGVF